MEVSATVIMLFICYSLSVKSCFCKNNSLFIKGFSCFVSSDMGATDQAAVWPRKKRKSNAVKNKNDSDASSRYMCIDFVVES